MHMFIANGMHQNVDFQYRLPETKTYRTQLIPIGQQIRISGDLSQKDIERVIESHLPYGMVAAREISKFKGFFIPYVYSVGEPVTSEQITELILQNREYNENLGRKLRKEAAVAVSASIEEGTTDTLRNFEMTIEELPSKDRDPTFSDAIRVTRDKERGAPQGPIDFSRKIVRPSF
jgi:hypothetical protein